MNQYVVLLKLKFQSLSDQHLETDDHQYKLENPKVCITSKDHEAQSLQ